MFIKVEDIDLHAAIPRQVHLALTGDPHEMTVMWATKTSNVLSIVEVWPFERPNRKKQFRGNIATLEGSATIIHTVLIQGLHQGQKYGYRVGDPTIDTWCRDYWFETRARKAPVTRFVALGDMDLREDGTRQNIEFLRSRLMEFDVMVILGDLCYKWGEALDEMGEALEAIAAFRPVMVLPGNHEWDDRDDQGFHAFNTRWHMPENGYMNQWYSWSMGDLHFVSLCTEDSLEPGSVQGRWLINDLRRASARGEFTVFMAHKVPIGSADKKWLNKKSALLRQDLKYYFANFGIPIALWGHLHLYERTQPVGACTYMTIGCGGARLDTEWHEPQPHWSAFRLADYGACFFQFDHSQRQLSMQYRTSKNGEIVDSFVMADNGSILASPFGTSAGLLSGSNGSEGAHSSSSIDYATIANAMPLVTIREVPEDDAEKSPKRKSGNFAKDVKDTSDKATAKPQNNEDHGTSEGEKPADVNNGKEEVEKDAKKVELAESSTSLAPLATALQAVVIAPTESPSTPPEARVRKELDPSREANAWLRTNQKRPGQNDNNYGSVASPPTTTTTTTSSSSSSASRRHDSKEASDAISPSLEVQVPSIKEGEEVETTPAFATVAPPLLVAESPHNHGPSLLQRSPTSNLVHVSPLANNTPVEKASPPTRLLQLHSPHSTTTTTATTTTSTSTNSTTSTSNSDATPTPTLLSTASGEMP